LNLYDNDPELQSLAKAYITAVQRAQTFANDAISQAFTLASTNLEQDDDWRSYGGVCADYTTTRQKLLVKHWPFNSWAMGCTENYMVE